MDSTELICDVIKLEYMFDSGEGKLYMKEANCCDMSGCISMFERIDKHVKLIRTFAGDKEDTYYMLVNKEWQSFSRN